MSSEAAGAASTPGESDVSPTSSSPAADPTTISTIAPSSPSITPTQAVPSAAPTAGANLPTPTQAATQENQAEEMEVTLSNIRATSFAASWVTDTAVTCELDYGISPDLGTVALDDRGESYQGVTHYFTLPELDPGSAVYFDLICGGKRFDNGGDHYQVQLGPSLAPAPGETAYGQIFDAAGNPAVGALVYLQVEDADGQGSSGVSALMSCLVDGEGYWYLNLGNARALDQDTIFEYSLTDDLIMEVFAGYQRGSDLRLGLADISPAEDIILDY